MKQFHSICSIYSLYLIIDEQTGYSWPVVLGDCASRMECLASVWLGFVAFNTGRLCSPICPPRVSRGCCACPQLSYRSLPRSKIQEFSRVYALCLRMYLQALGYQELHLNCIRLCELLKGNTLDPQIVGCDQVTEYPYCFPNQPCFWMLMSLIKVAKWS